MIRVEARYFAAFREQAGCQQESISTNATNVEELYAEVATRHGFLDRTSRCKVAINDALADWRAPIRQGDVVLFFPPVAGG